MMITWKRASRSVCQHVAEARVTDAAGNARRPIPQRSDGWAIRTARWLQRAGIRPNQISLVGVAVAALGAVCLILACRTDGSTRAALLLGAALAIPVRLLCNMLDGMLAVEGGLKTATG